MDRSWRIAIISVFLSSYQLLGCASTKISVQSFPDGAEVWTRSLGNSKARLVGRTPLILRGDELVRAGGAQEAQEIQLRKDGYKDESIFITDASHVDINITRRLSPSMGWKDAASLNRIVEALFEARSLSEAKRHEDALALLAQLKKDYPNLAAVHELEGGIFFLQGKYPSALDSYYRASEYNPLNGNLSETVRQLERLLGVPPRTRLQDIGRLPAAENASSDDKGGGQ